MTSCVKYSLALRLRLLLVSVSVLPLQGKLLGILNAQYLWDRNWEYKAKDPGW
jgi:hypothetical protein